MDTLSPDIGFVLTTSPPEACAGQKTKMLIDLRLHNQAVSKATLSLPIGTGGQHVVTSENSGYIVSMVATDYLVTPSTFDPFVASSKDPYWTVSAGVRTGESLTFTLTPAHPAGHTTDHLHLELMDVRLNTAVGTAELTLTTYIDDTPSVTKASLHKLASGLKLENFQAVGKLTSERRENAPVMKVWNQRPLRLTWDAQDVKELTLRKGSEPPVTLRPDQRSYPDPLDPDAKPLVLATDTKFTLSATGNTTGTAEKDIYLMVYQPDGEYTDLTVTGDFKIPEQKTIGPLLYPVKEGVEATFTAPSDGYYSFSFSTYRRFLRVFPPVHDSTSPPLFRVTVSGETFTCSFDASNGGSTPLVLFAPAGTKVTLKAPHLTPVDNFSEIPAAAVTWTGPQPDSALPAPAPPHEALPMHTKIPLCVAQDSYGSDHEDMQWRIFSKDDIFEKVGDAVATRTSVWVLKGSDLSLQRFYGVAWLANDTTVKAFARYWAGSGNGSDEISVTIPDSQGVAGIALEMLKPPPPFAAHYVNDGENVILHVERKLNEKGEYEADIHTVQLADDYVKDSPEEEKSVYSLGISYVDGKKVDRVRKCTMESHVKALVKGGSVQWRGNLDTVGIAGTQEAWLELKDFKGANEPVTRTGPVPALPPTGMSFTIPGAPENIVITAESVKVGGVKVDWEGGAGISIISGWTVNKEGIWHDGTKVS
ncbi:hypothetical protein [Streptomyces spectabilis]|uniref:Uncharacterized protein n=1 Tax=Streptomyces spectabilis TaxID=68270 RepID=A0A7W8B6W5_STRST|nr:hypothetical protein [Streptomyces spectabilis]MBB5109942.1 hypothetical protein [Streptomyces spectabilis]GGV56622.1 hypothetical protein GCM10010245_89600 [Streptomyces spectabilis]